jgi:hypothetical protein
MLQLLHRSRIRIHLRVRGSNYPEVAALYFWLPDSAQGTLQKRTKTLPELKPPGLRP